MAEATAVTPPSAAKPSRFSGLVQKILVPVLAVFTALVVGGFIIWISGGNPLEAYRGLLEGAFGSPRAISATMVWSTPYILAGLAVALAFKGGLFNIGAEGQLALGAVAAAWLGYGLPQVLGTTIPAIIHLPLCIIGGAVAGGLWGAIPGWLKARFGAHEVINTIMMNYIALGLVSFLLNGPMKDPSPTNVIARTPEIAETARIGPIFADPALRVHWGTVLAFVVAFLVWFLLWKMTVGFEIRTVGTSSGAARYAGINVGRTIILTMFLSGALAGLAGAIEVTGLNYRHELSFALGYGFDAIAIALLGRTHPFGVVLAAILFGAMRSGATRMQFLTQIPIDIISVVQALILLFVAADEIIRYMYRIKAPKEEVIMTRGWGG
jgi:simple sugar transport system permease protein